MDFTLTLPDWTTDEIKALPDAFNSVEERMNVVIKFSRLNYERGTGGPFAAGVFERDTGKLVAMGVNRVMAHNCSSAHAEIMALSLAQQILGTYDLGGSGMPTHQLVVNWLPCAMCFGAMMWSGVKSLVIAGSDHRLQSITGFDEGPITPIWKEELEKRGIELIDNVLTESAIKVYEDFARSGSVVYNARQGGSVIAEADKR
jgi:tRNA(Arg) A34 adenosine deaminase TadA